MGKRVQVQVQVLQMKVRIVYKIKYVNRYNVVKVCDKKKNKKVGHSSTFLFVILFYYVIYIYGWFYKKF
jgi:hypothetical protein